MDPSNLKFRINEDMEDVMDIRDEVMEYLQADDRGIAVRIYWNDSEGCYEAVTTNSCYQAETIGDAVEGAVADEVETQS